MKSIQVSFSLSLSLSVFLFFSFTLSLIPMLSRSLFLVLVLVLVLVLMTRFSFSSRTPQETADSLGSIVFVDGTDETVISAIHPENTWTVINGSGGEIIVMNFISISWSQLEPGLLPNVGTQWYRLLHPGGDLRGTQFVIRREPNVFFYEPCEYEVPFLPSALVEMKIACRLDDSHTYLSLLVRRQPPPH